MVSGDVKNPGRMSILEGVRSVVDAINRAGGPLAGGQRRARGPTSRSRGAAQGQVILTAQYSELLAGGDIAVQKGDEIVVRPNSRVFTVLGAVLKSGNVEMTKPNLTLLEALGQVGGLTDERANKTGVYVFRMGDIQNNPDGPGAGFPVGPVSASVYLRRTAVRDPGRETWCMSRMRHFTSTTRS